MRGNCKLANTKFDREAKMRRHTHRTGPTACAPGANGLLHICEASKALGLPMGKVAELHEAGLFPPPVIGFPMLWSAEAIRAWALGERVGREGHDR